ncbi:hypothetical protein GE21DRAFT_1034044 [Neurospora crassa]|nr:hypothetical protein GE21DRAFT_1034044 [Neurospora crassa]
MRLPSYAYCGPVKCKRQNKAPSKSEVPKKKRRNKDPGMGSSIDSVAEETVNKRTMTLRGTSSPFGFHNRVQGIGASDMFQVIAGVLRKTRSVL